MMARSILEARPSSRQVGICVQFLALVRTLAEFFWLEHIEGPLLRVATVAPYVDVGLLAALPTLDRSALLLRWHKHPQWSEAIQRSIADTNELCGKLIEAFGELKVQRISHCEALRVTVAFAVVEQAFEEF